MPILDIPWEQSKYLKMKYGLRTMGGSLYSYPSRNLPDELKQFSTPDFSYARWIEDDLNAKQGLPPTPTRWGKQPFTPREHQVEGARKIARSWAAGWSGFLLSDKTGLGKTLTTLVGIGAIAKNEGFTPDSRGTLLIVCPKGAIPVWRNTLSVYPPTTRLLRVLIINYQQLHKLLETSSEMKEREKRRRAAAKRAGRRYKALSPKAKAKELSEHGKSKVDWNYIVFDESHYLKNYPDSNVSRTACAVANLNKPYVKGKTPFVVFSTATPGSTPLNLAVMAGIIGRLLTTDDSGKKVIPRTWGAFLQKQGFKVTETKNGWSWVKANWWTKTDDPKAKLEEERRVKSEQRADTIRIGKALKKENAPFIKRSPDDIANWPKQQFIPLPLDMTVEQQSLYQKVWSAFRDWLKLTPTKKDPQGALAQQLRYRQKTSLIKASAMIDFIQELVDADNQVYVSVEFVDTIDEYLKHLKARKITVSEISGRNVAERENERLKFQRGESKVVICTVKEALSLHAGETLPDGSKATSAERVTILNDIRQNPLDAIQTAGRAHRDGTNSLTYIPYLNDTVDESVVNSFIVKEANQKAMTGSDDEEIRQLEEIFRKAAEGS